MRLDPTEGEMLALLVCDLTLGGCRLTGAKEVRRAVRRVRPSHSSQFIGLLAGVVLIMGGLAYFPAVSLGPVTERVAMNRGIHYPAP
jgi:K+-transporting ATPase A subunit